MRTTKKVIIILVVWLMVSWPLLIAIGFKPKGSKVLFKLLAQKFSNPEELPDPLILCDFESSKNMEGWHCPGVQLRFSSEFVGHGRTSAQLRFMKTEDSEEGYPGLISENYLLGPGAQRDWSIYCYFEFDAANPAHADASLYVKLKDTRGFQYQWIFDLKAGQRRTFTIELDEIRDMIDLKNMAYLKIFLCSPKEEVALFFDNIKLREKLIGEKNFFDEPFIKFSGADYPKQVRLRGEMDLTFYFMTEKKLNRNYKLFVHLMPEMKMRKGLSFIKGRINADFYPEIPTTEWRVNTVYMVGPVRVAIPPRNPKGRYYIRAGLFNEEQQREGATRSSLFANRGGPYDFSDAYPKLKYKNKKLKNYIVGEFIVE